MKRTSDTIKLAKDGKLETPEKVIQRQVEAYLRLRRIEHFHIPDELFYLLSKLASKQPVAQVILSKIKDIPDLLCFYNGPKYTSCLILEVKKKSGKLTKGQSKFHEKINFYTGYSFEECKQIIDEWIEFSKEEAARANTK